MAILKDTRGLKRNPTVEGWRAEIFRIKDGERLALLEELSYEEWVEQLLEDSSNTPVAQAKFVKALDQVVQSWQPGGADWPELEAMIELIAAYTPRRAYIKLFLAFEAVVALGHHPKTTMTMVWILDALHQYYPVEPRPEDRDGYEAYMNLLRRCLGLSGCERVAARRLVDRDPEALLDTQVLRVIQHQPAFLAEVIDLALDTPGEALQARRLSLVHESAVRAGSASLQDFVDAVEARDGKYEYQASMPKIVLPRRSGSIDLKFRYDETAKAYVVMRNTAAQNDKRKIIESIERQAMSHAEQGAT